MPSREVAKWTGQSPLVFRMRQTVRLFLSCRETAIIASPQGDSMRKTVLALVTFGALGAACVRFWRIGDHSGAGAQLLTD